MRIVNSIELNDGMTPVLKNMMKIMERTIKVMERQDKASRNLYNYRDIKKAKAAYKDLASSVDGLTSSLKRMSTQAEKSNSKLAGITNIAKTSKSGYSNLLSNLAHGLYTAERLYNYGKAAFGGIDMMKSQKSLIRLSNDSPRSVEDIYEDVIGIALGTRSSLSATGDTVGRLLSSGALKGRAGGNMANALKYTEMLNKAMVSSGRSAEEIERAMVQLNQGLGQNILQGDELRSIREQVPYFAAILAEGISRKGGQYAGTTMGDLKGLGASGVLTTDFILDALDRVQDKINKDYELTEKTFGQGITMLQTLWLKFLNSMSDAGKPFDRLTKMVWNLVEFLQTAEGETFFDALAQVLDLVISGIELLARAVGQVIMFIANNSELVISILVGILFTINALNVALAIAAALSAGVFWPIMLIGVAIGLVVYWVLQFKHAMEDAGYTAVDVGIMILQVITIIIGAVLTLVTVITAAIISAGSTVFSGLAYLFFAMCSGIAKAVSWVTGAVESAINAIIAKINAFISLLNSALGLANAVLGTDYHINTVGNVGGVSSRAASASEYLLNRGKGIWEGNKGFVSNQMFGKNGLAMFPLQTAIGLTDKLEGFKNTDQRRISKDTPNGFGDFQALQNAYNTSDLLNDIADNTGDLASPGGTNPHGGSLDSVKDVSLSDEDVKLLRDMSARDYLMKLQQITPMVTNTFGDVRETADVNKILEVIETMAREQLASSMVTVG